MSYLMKLNVGDWSDDGHGKTKEIVYLVNYDTGCVQEAYKASCLLTGVQFNHNEDFTGGLCKGYDSWRQIYTEYECDGISFSAREVLSKFIPNLDDILGEGECYLDTSTFSTLWWEFVKLSLPDLTYEGVSIDNINGYWDDNLNVQFGYGLFN